MDYLNIKVPEDVELAVIGDVHEHPKQYFDLVKKIQPSEKRWLISVGDVYDKGFGPEVAEEITNHLKGLVDKQMAYVIRGNHELKAIRKYRRQLSDALMWWRKQPIALSFVYPNDYRVTIVHGGVTPKTTWDDLGKVKETCYVRSVDPNGNFIPLMWVEEDGVKKLVPKRPDGKVWHEPYDGRFGYIASGHAAQKDGLPKFYENSCNLDTACYHTGILTGQLFSKDGLGKLITVTGTPKFDEDPFAHD